MNKVARKRLNLAELSELTGVDRSIVIEWVEHEWLSPVASNEFDEEDLTRLRLIQELRDTFGANDEAIPVILHLLDQLYALRHRLRKLGG